MILKTYLLLNSLVVVSLEESGGGRPRGPKSH